MRLSDEQVRRIAKLASLELTKAEVEKYREQLSDILSYIEKLNELDTSKVTPASQATGLKNVFRKDKLEKNRNLESKKGTYYEVTSIFQDD